MLRPLIFFLPGLVSKSPYEIIVFQFSRWNKKMCAKFSYHPYKPFSKDFLYNRVLCMQRTFECFFFLIRSLRCSSRAILLTRHPMWRTPKIGQYCYRVAALVSRPQVCDACYAEASKPFSPLFFIGMKICDFYMLSGLYL